MPRSPTRPHETSDGETFLRRFLGDPRRTGAILPSSPFLARKMAQAVDPDAPGLVIELGPGTGPVTEALLARGVRAENLLLVEFDPAFCALLQARFAPARIVRGDAYALVETLIDLSEPVAAVVSSLPLLNEPPGQRFRLLEEAFALMGPEGVFVQFTYGLAAPIPRGPIIGHYVATRSAPVLRNLPPASVWTYRRLGEGVAPDRLKALIADMERFGQRIKARGVLTEAALERRMQALLDHRRKPRP